MRKTFFVLTCTAILSCTAAVGEIPNSHYYSDAGNDASGGKGGSDEVLDAGNDAEPDSGIDAGQDYCSTIVFVDPSCEPLRTCAEYLQIGGQGYDTCDLSEHMKYQYVIACIYNELSTCPSCDMATVGLPLEKDCFDCICSHQLCKNEIMMCFNQQ